MKIIANDNESNSSLVCYSHVQYSFAVVKILLGKFARFLMLFKGHYNFLLYIYYPSCIV